MPLFLSSVGGLYFTEGNSCSSVLKGLLQTFILCFFSVLVRGSVIVLMYGSAANPSQGSEGSISSKNDLTKSSGLGVAFSVWVFIALEIIVFGYPFDLWAALTCCNSFILPSSMVGRLKDVLIRVLEVLILCFKTWCEAYIVQVAVCMSWLTVYVDRNRIISSRY